MNKFLLLPTPLKAETIEAKFHITYTTICPFADIFSMCCALLEMWSHSTTPLWYVWEKNCTCPHLAFPFVLREVLRNMPRSESGPVRFLPVGPLLTITGLQSPETRNLLFLFKIPWKQRHFSRCKSTYHSAAKEKLICYENGIISP